MLGIFELDQFGRYVLSGGNSEEFIWDLFDQQVMAGNTSLNVNGTQVFISQQQDYVGDSEERAKLRGTSGWLSAHCNYFANILTNGNPILGLGNFVNQDFIYSMHAMVLIARVSDSSINMFDDLLYNNVALYKFGAGTPEFYEMLSRKPLHDYPYDDYDPIHVINYLVLSGVLTVTNGSPYWLVTPQEVENWQQKKKEEIRLLREEEDRLIKEQNEQRKFYRRTKPRS